MKRGSCRFIVRADTDLDDVLAEVRRRVDLRAEPSARCVRRYYDSFDWLLYNAGTVFYQEGVGKKKTHLHWEPLGDERPKDSLAVPKAPRFAEELPTGRFRDALASVLDLRALLPLAEVRYRQAVFTVLDANEKTVARLVVEDNATASNTTPGKRTPLNATLHVLPVKGYHHAYKTLCKILHRQPGLAPADGHPLLPVLQALGRAPGDTAPKKEPVLDPEMRADAAVKQILQALFETLERNEPGLREDLDSEFLHDFRVAVRRTRSVLGQIKKVFPPEILMHFRPAFKWLGSVTGPTRDLDVYLIKFEKYQTWLPPSVQQDLIPLRHFLRLHQKQEHARLVETLDSPRYRALTEDWQGYLETPVPKTPPTPEAARPVLRVASERIWKAHKKVLHEGAAIIDAPETPAEKLHQLRITCKKLRYLLELFRSLYPPKIIRKLILTLKQLQDNLGDFNDCEVQQDTLHQFALQMVEEGEVPTETFLAVGRLEARLEMLQHETREAFTERFTKFAALKNQKRFKDLFKRQLPVAIGRALQPFPRSKPDVRLSPHPAFRIDAL